MYREVVAQVSIGRKHYIISVYRTMAIKVVLVTGGSGLVGTAIQELVGVRE
jgi:hypothetical protein